MSTFSKKLKYIFWPFLLIAIGFIGIYTLLDWALTIKTNTLSLKEDMVKIWLPLILVWIPLILLLRPKVKLLRPFKNNKGDRHSLYLFLACLFIAIPTIMTQFYLETASGELTNLDRISQMGAEKASKYYTLKHYAIDKTYVGVYNVVTVSGKHNEDFDMDIYLALPIRDTATDTSTNCRAFIGQHYYKRISNKLSDEEKDKQFQAFAEESQKEYDALDASQFVYLDKIGNSDDGDAYKEALKKSERYNSDQAVVFKRVNEPFDQRNGNMLQYIGLVLGAVMAFWLLLLVMTPLNEEALAMKEQGIKGDDADMKDFMEFVKPREGYFITPILIYINLLVFLAMVFSGLGFIDFKTDALLRWGANYRPSTINGEWWRLLTSTFLHGGLMHVLANMYGLLFVGIFLEPLLGRTKYLIIYLLTGTVASAASLWWYPATVSVGASGAIFGLYGLFLALLLMKVYPPEFGKTFLVSTIIFIGFNLVMGLSGGTDNAAHVGGLLSGFVIGLCLSPSLKGKFVEIAHTLEEETFTEPIQQQLPEQHEEK